MSREQIAISLKSARKRAGKSVEDVKELLLSEYGISISNKALYGYESGYRQPDADTLMAMCKIYGISDVLAEFGYSENGKDDETISSFTEFVYPARDTEKSITEKLPKLTDSQLESIERRVDVYIDDNEMEDREVISRSAKKAT